MLVGTAQDIYASLSAEQAMCYDMVKSVILRIYELVQRPIGNTPSVQDDSFMLLRELVLLEEIKNCVPNVLMTYLNEQKVATLAQAA